MGRSQCAHTHLDPASHPHVLKLLQICIQPPAARLLRDLLCARRGSGAVPSLLALLSVLPKGAMQEGCSPAPIPPSTQGTAAAAGL